MLHAGRKIDASEQTVRAAGDAGAGLVRVTSRLRHMRSARRAVRLLVAERACERRSGRTGARRRRRRGLRLRTRRRRVRTRGRLQVLQEGAPVVLQVGERLLRTLPLRAQPVQLRLECTHVLVVERQCAFALLLCARRARAHIHARIAVVARSG